MLEQRNLLLKSWQKDAIGRLLHKRSSELSFLSARAVGLRLPEPKKALAAKPKLDAFPMHAVRWVPQSQVNERQHSPATFFVDLRADVATDTFSGAASAMKSGATIFTACSHSSPHGVAMLNSEVRQCWQFVQLVQTLLEHGCAGNLVLVCPAASVGAMVAGASKAVAMEAQEIKIQRLFVPASSLNDPSSVLQEYCALASQYQNETDLWLTDGTPQGRVCCPRLEPMPQPRLSGPCLEKHAPDGSLLTYVLTGATGGLGSAVVKWIIQEQSLLPQQLVLLRRTGGSQLMDELKDCRVVEVADISNKDLLVSSGLRDVHNIAGVFHLAGVLDDGIISKMTEDRILKVAEPKVGALLAILHTAKALQWPLRWVLGFSSTSSLFGYGGQTNYCAANAVIDHMATFGQNDGLPCRVLAINWGPWGEAGMAKEGTKAHELALRDGDRPLPTAVALRCLAAALNMAAQPQQAAMQFCVCDVDWERSQWQRLPLLRDIRGLESSGPEATRPKPNPAVSAQGNPKDQVERFLLQHVKGGKKWARVQDKSLIQVGLDSLEIVQVRNLFNQKFSVNVPLSTVADSSMALNKLAEKLGNFLSA